MEDLRRVLCQARGDSHITVGDSGRILGQHHADDTAIVQNVGAPYAALQWRKEDSLKHCRCATHVLSLLNRHESFLVPPAAQISRAYAHVVCVSMVKRELLMGAQRIIDTPANVAKREGERCVRRWLTHDTKSIDPVGSTEIQLYQRRVTPQCGKNHTK